MEANNVEAMREALRAALDLIFDMQNADRSPLSNQAYAVRRKIKAALARPLRECDVATADEAIGAYRQTHKHMVVNVFLDWLYAPAMEKEGDVV